jgi:hypothetical protein
VARFSASGSCARILLSSSLRDGAVDSILSLDERTLLFGWREERGFGMGPIVIENGWGIWKSDASHTRLKGIWWYDVKPPMHYPHYSLRAYAWELEKGAVETTTSDALRLDKVRQGFRR